MANSAATPGVRSLIQRRIRQDTFAPTDTITFTQPGATLETTVPINVVSTLSATALLTDVITLTATLVTAINVNRNILNSIVNILQANSMAGST